jgi:hypothetical protein
MKNRRFLNLMPLARTNNPTLVMSDHPKQPHVHLGINIRPYAPAAT